MTKRKSITKRQRPIPLKERHPAVLKQIKQDVVATGVSVGERELVFARALADTEERVRTESLKSLRAYLTENATALGGTELDRLWKALFYCVWMADKRPRITAVIEDIVDLEEILGMKHIHALFRCMVREWTGIDKHRVDKFYELLNAALERCVMRVTSATSIELLHKAIDEMLECIKIELTAKIIRGGKGLLMHVLDKWVDLVLSPALEKANSFSRNEVHWVWDQLLKPFHELLESSDERFNAVKIRFEERVIANLGAAVSSERLKLDARTRHDMLNRVSKWLYMAASGAAEISDACRQRLWDLRTEVRVVLINLKSAVPAAAEGEGDESLKEDNK